MFIKCYLSLLSLFRCSIMFIISLSSLYSHFHHLKSIIVITSLLLSSYSFPPSPRDAHVCNYSFFTPFLSFFSSFTSWWSWSSSSAILLCLVSIRCLKYSRMALTVSFSLIKSEAFSAIITCDVYEFPLVNVGITLASTTLRPFTVRTL